MDTVLNLIVFVVTAWLGYKIITEVPSLLHTPLMSGTNAVSGVTILGSLVSAALSVHLASKILAFVAIVFACINLVAGFLVTDHMLRMFKN